MKFSKEKNNKIALLLTGGGARAAYQVGVLKAISTCMPRHHGVPFKIICGTSAGSINATALSCYASCYHLGVKKVEWIWKNFRTKQIYHTDFFRVFRHIGRGFLSTFQSEHETQSPVSLLDNQPLRHLLRHVLDLKRIDRHIMRNHLDAIAVTASSYSDGDSLTFFQANDNIMPWSRARRKGIPTHINSEHLMASSAIPFVFPSVKVDQNYFGDGSVHQLSPLSAPIHLGAEKIFIIGVEQNKARKYHGDKPHHPSAATIAGHLLDSVFSDTLNADIERMLRINSTLSHLPEKKTNSLKTIESMIINPSHDFDGIANQYFMDMPMAIRLLLRGIGVREDSESSLISYLLFEKTYTKHLIQLGFEDGMEQLQSIKHFLELD